MYVLLLQLLLLKALLLLLLLPAIVVIHLFRSRLKHAHLCHQHHSLTSIPA
jgi:hypothetical protein